MLLVYIRKKALVLLCTWKPTSKDILSLVYERKMKSPDYVPTVGIVWHIYVTRLQEYISESLKIDSTYEWDHEVFFFLCLA
jgi:hypothetical protein